MHKIKYLKKAAIILSLVMLANCSRIERENFVIRQSLIDSPSTVTLVEISGFDEPQFYRGGQSGLLDICFNKAFGSDLRASVKYISIRRFIEKSFFNRFASALKKSGFKVKIAKSLDRESLKTPENETSDMAPFDFSGLYHEYKTDYLMVLDPIKFGICREYYGFIPTGRPYGASLVRIYLVDLKTNMLEAYFAEQITVGTSEKWDDQGERYEEVTNAAEESAKQSINAAYEFFFDNFFHQMHLKVKAGEIEAPK